MATDQRTYRPGSSPCATSCLTTDAPARRVELAHDNIRRFGMIYNTLAAVSDIDDEIVAQPTA